MDFLNADCLICSGLLSNTGLISKLITPLSHISLLVPLKHTNKEVKRVEKLQSRCPLCFTSHPLATSDFSLQQQSSSVLQTLMLSCLGAFPETMGSFSVWVSSWGFKHPLSNPYPVGEGSLVHKGPSPLSFRGTLLRHLPPDSSEGLWGSEAQPSTQVTSSETYTSFFFLFCFIFSTPSL